MAPQKVSVCMITYNHEKFIAKAIEGIMMQKTNFNYNLIISEDSSTDSTKSIIEDYERRYPDQIQLLQNSANLGMHMNFKRAINACQGEYIAICEGDDFWIDPFKLQNQVDFLDANSDTVICGTNYNIMFENNDQHNILRNPSQAVLFGEFKDIIHQNLLATLTVVFRRSDSLTSLFFQKISNAPYIDWLLWSYLLNGNSKKFAILPSITAVQNIHQNGAFSSIKDSVKLFKNALRCKMLIYNFTDKDNKKVVAEEIVQFYLLHKGLPKNLKSRIKFRLLKLYLSAFSIATQNTFFDFIQSFAIKLI